MRNLFRKIFPKEYSPAWPLRDDESTTRPSMNPQRQSPFFDELSAELRLMVYHAVLVDQQRFLHICQNVPSRKWRKVAHFWCTNMELPFPTWQHHTCYGEDRMIVPAGNVFSRRCAIETDDKLLAILLVCRRLYSEALAVLYQGNTFHFRGSTGLLAFTSTIPTVQWSAIRRVHISTLFDCSWCWDRPGGIWLPDNIVKWSKCCEQLGNIPKLESLTLDLVVQIGDGTWDANEGKQRVLEGILPPLKRIEATTFEVEVNVEPSQELYSSIGAVGFVIVQRERVYNVEIYGDRPRMEID